MVTLDFGGYMMHRVRNNWLIYGSTLLAGLSSLGLHRYMMDNCFDRKGLLIAGSLPVWLMLAIGAAFVAGMLLLLWKLGGNGTYEDNFPRDPISGILLIAAGAVMLWYAAHPEAVPAPQIHPMAGSAGAMAQLTERFKDILPWLAAVSMAVLGLFRILGRKAPAWFGGAVCLNYMLTLVTDYRLWSANPQLHSYAYQLLAEVLLMLCAFHRTSCDGGILQRRKLLFTGTAAAVCAMASLSLDFHRPFFLASALWGLGCVGTTAVLPPDPQEEPQAEAETPDQTEEPEA